MYSVRACVRMHVTFGVPFNGLDASQMTNHPDIMMRDMQSSHLMCWTNRRNGAIWKRFCCLNAPSTVMNSTTKLHVRKLRVMA